MKKKPELLAPAGDYASLCAAVSAGADAVYFGGKAFNARASAGNLDTDEIRQAVSLCRKHGVKTYLTLNTLIKEEEWGELISYVKTVLPLGIDAVIVQDPAVATCVHTLFPQVELHGSTQMAVHDADGARFLKGLGFTRVVLARELSLDEIKAIASSVDIELEVFIHGALCCSYSGRCLLSSFHGGRSGNRGQCAGACRLPYQVEGKPQYPMNLKDLCAAGMVYSLALAGVRSFKIEGRLKGIPYIYGVTQIYKGLLERDFSQGSDTGLTLEERRTLAQLYNRGDFTDGYLLNDKSSMVEPDSPKHQGVAIGTVTELKGSEVLIRTECSVSAGDVLEIRTQKPPYPTIRLSAAMASEKPLRFRTERGPAKGDKVYRLTDAKLGEELLLKAAEIPDVPVTVSVCIKVNRQALLTLKNTVTGREVTVAGAVAEPATGRPLTEEDLTKSFSRFGGTGYCVCKIEAETDGQSFLPVSSLNALRREACAKLDEPEPRTADADIYPCSVSGKNNTLFISLETKEQWKHILNVPLGAGTVLMPSMLLEDAELAAESLRKGFCLVPSLPLISRHQVPEQERESIRRWLSLGAEGFEAHHFGEIARIKEAGAKLYTGWGLGPMNRTGCAFLQNKEAKAFVISAELERKEAELLSGVEGATLVVYGKIPLMVTEQCFYREAHGCRKNPEGNRQILTDRMEARLTAQTYCAYCYNVLYDEKPLYLGDRKIGNFNKRLMFTGESGEEVSTVLSAYMNAKELPGTQLGHYNSKVI